MTVEVAADSCGVVFLSDPGQLTAPPSHHVWRRQRLLSVQSSDDLTLRYIFFHMQLF